MLDKTKCISMADYFIKTKQKEKKDLFEQYYQRNQLVDAEKLMTQLAFITNYQFINHINDSNETKVNLIFPREESIFLNNLETTLDWKQFYQQFCLKKQKELLAYHSCRMVDSPFYNIDLNYYRILTKEGVLAYFYQKESPLSQELLKLERKKKIKILI